MKNLPILAAAALCATAAFAQNVTLPKTPLKVGDMAPDFTVAAGGTAPIVLNLAENRCVPPVVEQLREVLRTHPGTTEVHLRLRGNQKTTVVRLDDKLRVTASPALHADLKQLLGPSCIAS